MAQERHTLYPEIKPLDRIIAAIRNSDAVECACGCAYRHAYAARGMPTSLPASCCREALTMLADYSMQRTF